MKKIIALFVMLISSVSMFAQRNGIQKELRHPLSNKYSFEVAGEDTIFVIYDIPYDKMEKVANELETGWVEAYYIELSGLLPELVKRGVITQRPSILEIIEKNIAKPQKTEIIQ